MAIIIKDNVVRLPVVTTLDLPVDVVLDGAKEKLEGAVIIGYDKEGEYYFASTYADKADILWLINALEKKLLG